MFKLVILFAVAAVCLPYPSLIAASPFISYSTSSPYADIAYQPPPALATTVGAVVRTIPTSVSHNSHAVVHKSDQFAQDVLAPIIKTTFAAPISYTTHASGPVSYASYPVSSPYA